MHVRTLNYINYKFEYIKQTYDKTLSANDFLRQ